MSVVKFKVVDLIANILDINKVRGSRRLAYRLFTKHLIGLVKNGRTIVKIKHHPEVGIKNDMKLLKKVGFDISKFRRLKVDEYDDGTPLYTVWCEVRDLETLKKWYEAMGDMDQKVMGSIVEKLNEVGLVFFI